jgi:NAD(P)H-dependent FMN reductase
MLKLKIIIGSTRDGRAADAVAPWIIDRARADGGFDVEVLDLRDWPLPMFAETFATIGDPANPTYSDPIVKRWNERITDGDVFIFITPEYNHSVPGVLKNAIDNVFVSYGFRNKAALFVGYSAGQVAAARAVEHLAHMAIEAEMVPLRNPVLIRERRSARSDDRSQPARRPRRPRMVGNNAASLPRGGRPATRPGPGARRAGRCGLKQSMPGRSIR